jgi:hypothetical protein
MSASVIAFCMCHVTQIRTLTTLLPALSAPLATPAAAGRPSLATSCHRVACVSAQTSSKDALTLTASATRCSGSRRGEVQSPLRSISACSTLRNSSEFDTDFPTELDDAVRLTALLIALALPSDIAKRGRATSDSSLELSFPSSTDILAGFDSTVTPPKLFLCNSAG